MRTFKGDTALVTGASSGIGEAIAHRLAQDGVHLGGVARSADKLQRVADAVKNAHHVRATIIVTDLSKPGSAAAIRAYVDAHAIVIDILVNNAGFGTYGAFEDIHADLEQNEVAVNIAALVDLTHAFLPAMLLRGRGFVLNIASTAAFQPVPYMAVYAATKAFVVSFSEALWAECRDRGVHVVALCPGAVDTPFFASLDGAGANRIASFSRRSRVEEVADEAIGALCGRGPTRIPGLRNWMMAQSARFAPRAVVARMGAGIFRPPS